MPDASDNTPNKPSRKPRSLKNALYVVKNRQADRDDVVIDMRAAEEARLELLVEELSTIVTEIDDRDERFEFALSKGERPRFWIDATSFVSMGHDRRTYRFLKDTRMGRIVLAENGNVEKMADTVSEYIAEQILERERAIEGEWVSMKNGANSTSSTTKNVMDLTDDLSDSVTPEPAKNSIWRTIYTMLFGAALTLVVLVIAAYYLVPEAFKQI